MNINEILKLLEKVAPVSLSDEFCKKYGLYDNSGIILNCGGQISGQINGVLFSLDLSLKAIDQAKKHGFNLIVTHHPAIYGGISRIDTASDPLAKALAECLKSGISVISMHLNFDAAPKGIDYYLMKGLGGEGAEMLAPVTGGGYGRVYSIDPLPYKEYIEKVKEEFSTERLLAYGPNKPIKKIASFCGAGCDEKAIAFAVENGADLLVSADMKHHQITALLGHNINVIQLTHYASEAYGFGKIYSEISEGLPVPTAYFCDAELL